MFSGMPDGHGPGEHVRMEALEGQTSASVWSAIRYLDSSSNYRECLSRKDLPASLEETELILLDDLCKDSWVLLRNVTLTAGLACLALVLLVQS
jgi:hypothetical protein